MTARTCATPPCTIRRVGPVEHRLMPRRLTDIRMDGGSNGRRFYLQPVTYDETDGYGSRWTRGVFTRAAEERLPSLLYGHNWDDIGQLLGRGIDYEDRRAGPRALFEFSDFDYCPAARQAAGQINEDPPTLRDTSVGFTRVAGGWLTRDQLSKEDRESGAHERIIEAAWDEQSLVVRGAVKGAEILGQVRAQGRADPTGWPGFTPAGPAGTTAEELVETVARLVQDGVVSATEARAMLAGRTTRPPTRSRSDVGLAEALATANIVRAGHTSTPPPRASATRPHRRRATASSDPAADVGVAEVLALVERALTRTR